MLGCGRWGTALRWRRGPNLRLSDRQTAVLLAEVRLQRRFVTSIYLAVRFRCCDRHADQSTGSEASTLSRSPTSSFSVKITRLSSVLRALGTINPSKSRKKAAAAIAWVTEVLEIGVTPAVHPQCRQAAHVGEAKRVICSSGGSRWSSCSRRLGHTGSSEDWWPIRRERRPRKAGQRTSNSPGGLQRPPAVDPRQRIAALRCDPPRPPLNASGDVQLKRVQQFSIMLARSRPCYVKVASDRLSITAKTRLRHQHGSGRWLAHPPIEDGAHTAIGGSPQDCRTPPNDQRRSAGRR